MTSFAAETVFDDPGQMPPRVGGLNWMKLPLTDGLYISLWRSSPAVRTGAQIRFGNAETQALFEALYADRDAIAEEFLADGLPEPVWTTEEAAPAFPS